MSQPPPLVDLDALVLRVVDHSEQDRIVTLLVRGHGKVSAYARQARASHKRFAGGLELFCRYQVSLRERQRGMMALAEAEPREALRRIPRSIEGMAIAACGLELAREVAIEGSEQDELFVILWCFLCGVDAVDAPLHAQLALRWFEVRVLELLGQFPELTSCLRCDADLSETGGYFSAQTGGAVCASCRREDDHAALVSGMSLRSIARLYERELGEVLEGARARAATAQLEAFVRESGRLLGVLLRTLGLELKTYDYLARLPK